MLCYFLLVPDATRAHGHGRRRRRRSRRPRAQQWKAVAEVFESGIGNLHPMARQGIFSGLASASCSRSLERALPKHRQWLPSATGIGLGLLLPFYQPLSMFLGAPSRGGDRVAQEGQRAAALVVPIASGLIAGESIVGVVVAALNNFVLK